MWKNDKVQMEECNPNDMVRLIIGLAPYWIRFWQSIRKWLDADCELFPNIANAGKYASGMTIKVLGYYLSQKKIDLTGYVCFGIYYTTYCYVWDVIMDWGLFSGSK